MDSGTDMPPHTTPTAPATVTAARPTAVRPTPGKPGTKPDEAANGLRVLTYLRLHWLMIVFCGTLIGGGGAFAAWELLSSKFESYALLQVQSVPPTVANQNNPGQTRTDFVTYLKTTSALIKSEFVLNAALRDIKDLPTIKSQKDPIKFLDEELIVNWQDGSEVIRITFKSHEPADAKKIVDAVQAAFMKEVVQKDVQEKRIFVDKIEEAMTDMRKHLEKFATVRPGSPKGPDQIKQAGGIADATAPNGTPAGVGPTAPGQLPAIAPEAAIAPPINPNPVVQPASFNTKMDPRTLVSKIASLQAELERLPLSINDGKRRLAVLQQKMEAIRNAPVPQATLDAIEKDHDVIVQILTTKKAQRDYEFYAKAGDPNAPTVLQLKQAWDAHETRLKEIRKEKSNGIEGTRRVAEAQKVATEMEELIHNLNRMQEQFDVAKAILAKSEKHLAELPPSEKIMTIEGREVAGYRPGDSQTESTDSIYRRLVQQYYTTQMELNSPTRVRVLQQGSSPTQKEMKKQIMATVFAAFMGFGIMVFGVVAFETFAKRVSSLADVKTATPLPVVGVIPCKPSEANSRDAEKRTAANESLDRLRAHVSQAWLARGATTVAVTSPLGEEGKAFVAFGLASSLAQSGYKTLLVDFDLRDPQLHDFAGVPNSPGVCEHLRAETDLATALHLLPSGLHFLSAGKWSDEARKAATGEQLENLLERFRAPYDCVVIHGHALLTAAESVEVARRCEVVLVCALYRETTSPLLKRAAERVTTMEIPYSGVVYVGATGQEALC
ncbi:MAG: hypothetical protein C0467_18045 [Planctomycetaceae bacterium]|nr:hypothetical protein [Planctomycetaceae bacterium]